MSVSAVELASSWPFIAREYELETIADVRASGDCPGVVIASAAGVGKSGLARMALATAEHDGAFVHWVHATRSAARVPLGAFAGILAPDRGSDDLLELMRQSAGVLRTRAGDRAIVLGVDDAQLLDASSAALVLHLAVSSTAFVVATLRTGEPCEDAIAALSKDAGALRIELRPLDEAETGKLVESALGGLVEEGARRWVVDRSDGNPLYVRELLLGALGSGDLVQIGGLWQLAGRPAMSVSLGQLVETRMAALGRSERQAVELVAFGEPLPLPLVVELANPEAVAAAESHGMLVVDGGREGGTIRLAHPIYGEVVRASLPAAWARELRIRLASIVQATGPAGAEDSLRVARWLLDAGEVIPVGLLVSAANAALRAGDPNLGAELAGLAVDGGGGVEASLLLIRAHTRRRRFQEAELILERIEEPFESQELALDYLEQCISVRFWGLRRPEELSVLLERAAGWWSDDSWRERLQPLRLYAAPVGEVFGGNVDETAGILARPTLDRAVRRQLEPLHVAHLFYTGRTQEAHDLALRIRPSVPFSRQTDERALGLWAKVAIETGRDWPGLEAWMGEALGVAVRIGDQAAAGIASLTLGRLRILDGRFGEAARWLAEAEYCFEKQDTFGSLVTARSMQVVVACRTGELRQIAPALERCHAALGGHAPFPNQLPYLVRADAWSAWALGDRSAAQEQLLQGSDQTSSSPIHSAMLAYDAMRAGIPARRVTSRLTELADRCDAPLLSAYAAQAAATVAEDGVAVLTVADEMARIGALRYAMEAAAGAAGIFAREGRHDSARRAAAQSLAIFEQGDGGIPPAIDGMTADVRLTSREKQLVDLARQGLTNSDIATRLVLSVRTVESHLYRAMQKLGIKDRRDL